MMIDVPNDAWRVIISYLPPQALYRLGLTSKRFQKLTFESTLWKYFCNRDFGGYSNNPFKTYLNCKKNDWTLVQKIVGGENINFLDFKDSEIISGTPSEKTQIIKFFSGNRVTSAITLKTDSEVRSIIRHKDLLITGTNQIDIWNLEGKRIRTLNDHTNTISALIQENEKLISGSYDKTICIWDIEKKLYWTLSDYKLIRSLSLFNNELISAGGDGESINNLHLWDLRNPGIVASFDCSKPFSIFFQIHRMGNEVITGCGNVWDIRTRRLLHSYTNFYLNDFAPDDNNILGIYNHSFCKYANNELKTLFHSPNKLTHIKRLGERLLVGSTTYMNQESIYEFELQEIQTELKPTMTCNLN